MKTQLLFLFHEKLRDQCYGLIFYIRRYVSQCQIGKTETLDVSGKEEFHAGT